jgi:hypothetical protein
VKLPVGPARSPFTQLAVSLYGRHFSDRVLYVNVEAIKIRAILS